jgi:hypothetical protein
MAFRLFIAFVGICLAATPVAACDNGPFPISFVGGTTRLSRSSAEELDNSRGWLDVYLRHPSFAKTARFKISIFLRTAAGHALPQRLQQERGEVIRNRLISHGIPANRLVFVTKPSGRLERVGNAPASIELVQGCR